MKARIFCKNFSVLKCPLTQRFRYNITVFFNHGNKVASSSLRYYSKKVKESKNATKTYNSSYKYGPPDPESNIPTVEFLGKHNETNKEKMFRQHKQDLMLWHHTFWLQQNEKFKKEKKKHLQKQEHEISITDGKEQADDLSFFFKKFLDKEFSLHFKYQREWYKRNFLLFWYGFQVDLEHLVKRLMVKVTRSKSGS